MTLATVKLAAATFLVGLMLVAAPAIAGSSSIERGLAPLGRELDKVGRNLCKSLDLKCRKPKIGARRKARPQSAVKRAVPRDSDSTKKPGPSLVVKPKPLDAAVEVKPRTPPVTPVPRPKPVIIVSKAPNVGPIPPPLPRTKPVVSAPRNAVSGEACLAALTTSGVEFETVATPVGNGLCQVEVPVRLHSAPTPRGRIVLPDRPLLNCRFARQFALWLSDSAAAVVFARMNATLARTSTGPGYECRGRNGGISAKLSEHAFGNAVDIATIATADGRTIQIADAAVTTSPAFHLLRGLRVAACGYFSTVLGPGADAAHASHFHFDTGLHGKSQTYRICQ